MRYKKNSPPKNVQDVHEYIKNHPGSTAGQIAAALGIKHRNYVHQIIMSFELYDGVRVYEEEDGNKSKFYNFDKQELDNRGWI